MIAMEHVIRIAKHWRHDNDGKGMFGVVRASRSGDVVRKVTPADGAYISYCKWVREQPLNEHLPDVRRVREVGSGGIVTLEALEPLHVGDEELEWAFSELLMESGGRGGVHDNDALWVDYYGNDDEGEEAEYLASLLTESFWNTLNEVYFQGRERGYSCDVHGHNVMLRDGVLVITDPWYDKYGRSLASVLCDHDRHEAAAQSYDCSDISC